MSHLLAARIRTGLLWAAAVAVVLLYGFPFAYLVLTSFKPAVDAIAVPPTVLPERFSLDNYVTALNRPGVTASFVNSVSTAVIATLLSMALAIPAAWAITRYRTRTGRLLMAGSLLVRMAPAVAIGIPLVTILGAVNLTDTPTGLALAQTTVALPLSIWLLASFFEGVPREIEEAALVDGCGRFGALRRVILPVVSGGVAVTAIFAFLASWNEFLFALLLTSIRAQTTPIAIANFQSQFGLDWGPMTALATLYSVPAVVLTLLLQRRIVAGLSLGAVKG
ncbi:carbohydrate ABC transporter permease [Micromonospora endolithica]|uniref:Carbohydrate ABC transporter permease n=1 Tax=Micromonospora endolithica TaxID=230091 RepID=A0A3A9ZK82_9ACTN|nr:carbohydrate ABC transporter permease [Micromonospora endolithica]RKN48555.1 carbohydrate ABC transporter permease [Micromonospora endolithica]TWJ22123.1 carbohydrate ABC transporter membrane protein 2 (CUT1 family) [Micromonospora endolithica]